MRTPTQWCSMTLLLALSAAGLAAGCKSTSKETKVSLADLSPPARATVEKEIAGGHVDEIVRETEKGKVVYDVEATVGGRHMEYLVADADGALLGTEVPIEFGQLPEPVRTAAGNYFGKTDGLTVMKGVEYGETHYEVEGNRDGKKTEVTFDPNGKRVP